jgi:tetratricopeptide (TPR) repeat protein
LARRHEWRIYGIYGAGTVIPVMVARYAFYLANTLRDSGQREAALRIYLQRARLGHWQQEVFMSLLNAAMLKEALGYTNEDVMSAYMDAVAACPARAEALHGAARFCRTKGLYEQGYAFAARGLTITRPSDALFPEDWIYDYGLRDELAVCAYWTGRYAGCRDACDRLLSEKELPPEHRARILRNKQAAMEKLGETGAAPSSRANILHGREKEMSVR